MADRLSEDMRRTLSGLERPRRVSVREVRARVAAFERAWLRDPERWRVIARRGWPFAVAGAVALGVGAYLVLRPTPVPDYEAAPIDTLMSFTLLQEEFNRLPLERRLELIGTLVGRIEAMGSGDSLLLAAFAGSIRGAARDQLEENASRLAIDLWDSMAAEYQHVAEADREEFLTEAYVRFERAMEMMSGEVSDRTPEERLSRARAQAQRDERAMRAGEGPPPRAVGRIFDVMNNNLGGRATPLQRQRGHLLMRDMTRFLRGGGG